LTYPLVVGKCNPPVGLQKIAGCQVIEHVFKAKMTCAKRLLLTPQASLSY
jgi:hypothetical protein